MFSKKAFFLSLGVATAIMTGCGSSTTPGGGESKFGTGYYIDSAVSGISYKCGSKEGQTGSNGEFTFEKGESCTFTFAGITLRTVVAELLKDDEVTIIEDDIKVATFLQTMDADGNVSNGITIPAEIIAAMSEASIDALPQNADDIEELWEAIKGVSAYKGSIVSMEKANEHLQGTIKEEAQKSDTTIAFTIPKTFYSPDVDMYGNNYEFEYEILTFSNNNKFSYSEKELDDGSFVSGNDGDDGDDNDFSLKDGAWVMDSDNGIMPFTLSSDRKKLTLTEWNIELYQQSVVDMSGRAVALDGTDEIVTMPSGAKKTIIKFMRTADSYYVWESEDEVTLGDVVKNRCGTSYFTHAKEDSGINGIAFTCNQEGQNSGTLVGIKSDNSLVQNVGTWEKKDLQGSSVSALLLTVKPQYNRHSDNEMFAMKDGKVWRGEWEKAGVEINAWYNEVAMDAFKTKMIEMEDDADSGNSVGTPVVVTELESLLAGRVLYTHKGGADDYLTAFAFNADATSVIITSVEGPNMGNSVTRLVSLDGNNLTIGDTVMTLNNGSEDYAGFNASRFYFEQNKADAYYYGLTGNTSTITITEDMLNGKTFYYSFPVNGGVFYGKKSFSPDLNVSGHKMVIENIDGNVTLNLTYDNKPYTLLNNKQQVVGPTENLQFTLNGIIGNRWILTKEIDADQNGDYETTTDATWYFTKPDDFPATIDDNPIVITEDMLNGKTFYLSFSQDDGSTVYMKKSFSSTANTAQKIIIDADGVMQLNTTFDMNYELENGKQKTANLLFTLDSRDDNGWNLTKQISTNNDDNYDVTVPAVWYFTKPADYPDFSKPSEDFKFTTEWLNDKTLYNTYYESDDNKWELTVFKFTDEKWSAYDDSNVSKREDNVSYQITDEGYITFLAPWEDDDSTTEYISVIEETADYLKLCWTDTIGNIADCQDSDEYFYFNYQKAKDFVNSQ